MVTTHILPLTLSLVGLLLYLFGANLGGTGKHPKLSEIGRILLALGLLFLLATVTGRAVLH